MVPSAPNLIPGSLELHCILKYNSFCSVKDLFFYVHTIGVMDRRAWAPGPQQTNKHTYIDGMPSTITSARLSDRRSQHRSLLASEWLSEFPDDSQPMNLWGPIGSKSRMELQIAPPYTKARCVRQPKSKTRQSARSTQPRSVLNRLLFMNRCLNSEVGKLFMN